MTFTDDTLEGVQPQAELIALLTARGLTLAVAESLTGGLVTAELIRAAGASRVVNGGVVAYATEVKRTVLGVDADLLDEHGPVHPEVARQMADRVRGVLAIDGTPADIGLATTGVAGPDPQDTHAVGTVYLGLAIGDRVESKLVRLDGGRDRIRSRTVTELLTWLAETLSEPREITRGE